MKRVTQTDANPVQEHIFSTYVTLRYGMGIITLTFPAILYLAGVYDGVGLQDSLSAYYWASETATNVPRVFFVGGLFAMAAFLYLYKGFTSAENVAFNLAAILGVGVALVPMPWPGKLEPTGLFWHGIFAVSTFVCLVYVVWFRTRDTLQFLPEEDKKGPVTKPYSLNWYKAQYRVIGLVMLASPVTAAVLNWIFGKDETYIFFIESAGIWAFAWYWFLKSSELKRSEATRKVLSGQLAVENVTSKAA